MYDTKGVRDTIPILKKTGGERKSSMSLTQARITWKDNQYIFKIGRKH